MLLKLEVCFSYSESKKAEATIVVCNLEQTKWINVLFFLFGFLPIWLLVFTKKTCISCF